MRTSICFDFLLVAGSDLAAVEDLSLSVMRSCDGSWAAVDSCIDLFMLSIFQKGTARNTHVASRDVAVAAVGGSDGGASIEVSVKRMKHHPLGIRTDRTYASGRSPDIHLWRRRRF